MLQPKLGNMYLGAATPELPCSVGLTFQSDVLLPATGEWDNKIVGGDNIIIKSNVDYFNGTTAYSESIAEDDIYSLIDTVQIKYSYDNITWSTWNTGDLAISDLFLFDLKTKKFTLCKYLDIYISNVKLFYKTRCIIEFTNSSGYTREFNIKNELRLENKSVLIRFANDKALDNAYGNQIVSLFKEPTISSNNILVKILGQSNALTIRFTDISEVLGNYELSLFDKVFIWDFGTGTWKSLTTLFGEVNKPYKSSVYYGLELARSTGKSVYVFRYAVGSTGFYSSPGWKYDAVGEYYDYTVTQYNLAKSAINGGYSLGKSVWNLGEYDSQIQANAIASKEDLYNLITGLHSETVDVDGWIFILLHPRSYYVNNNLFGTIINDDKKLMAYNPNDDFYIPNCECLDVSMRTMDADKTHYYDTATEYYEIYKQAARLNYNRGVESDIIKFTQNKSVVLNANLNLGTSFYINGAKTLIFKFRFYQKSTDVDYIRNYTGASGMQLVIPANSSIIYFRIYNGTTAVLQTISGLEEGKDYIFAFSWDGTTGTNKFKLLLKTQGKDIKLSARTSTQTEPVLSASPLMMNVATANSDIYSLAIRSSELSDDEINALNNDHELTGFKTILFDTGYGTKIFDTDGNAYTINGTWHNNSPFPQWKWYDRELQVNSGNYRLAPIGYVEAGWSTVEVINKNSFYHILGGKIEFPQRHSLINIDIDNVLYNGNRLSKSVTLTDFTGVTYINTESDSYKITELSVTGETTSDVEYLPLIKYNTTTDKGYVAYNNALSECKIYEDISNNKIYLKSNDNGKYPIDTPDNYTYLRTQPVLDSKSIPLTDGVIRIDGKDFELQKLTAHADWLSLFYAREKIVDSTLVGYDRVCYYPIIPEASCRIRTLNFDKQDYIIDDDGNLALDEDEETLIQP